MANRNTVTPIGINPKKPGEIAFTYDWANNSEDRGRQTGRNALRAHIAIWVIRIIRQAISHYELEITNPFEDVTITDMGLDVVKRKPFTMDKLNDIKKLIQDKKDVKTIQIMG